MRVHTLFGWTFSQWAIAAGRLGRPVVSFLGARQLQDKWRNANPTDPGEVQLMLHFVEPMDWNFAADLFALPMPTLQR